MSGRRRIFSFVFSVDKQPQCVYCFLPNVARSSWEAVMFRESHQQIRTILVQAKILYTKCQRQIYYHLIFWTEPGKQTKGTIIHYHRQLMGHTATVL